MYMHLPTSTGKPDRTNAILLPPGLNGADFPTCLVLENMFLSFYFRDDTCTLTQLSFNVVPNDNYKTVQ